MRRALEALESRLHFSSTLSGLATVRAGAPDPTFGIEGVAPGESWALTNRSLAVQPDGKILVVGTYLLTTVGGRLEALNARYTSSILSGSNLAVTRYNADGTVDSSFGSGGSVLFSPDIRPDVAACVAVEPDGKILVGGYDQPPTAGNLGADLLVSRLNPDGSPDTSFGNAGNAVVASGGAVDVLKNLAILPDGKILLVSSSTGAAGTKLLLLRLDADGSVDPAFGVGGKRISDFAPSDAAGVASTGEIYVATARVPATPTQPEVSPNPAGVAFFTPDGALDATVGQGGFVPIPRATGLNGLVVTSAGNLVVSGSIDHRNRHDLYVASLGATGAIDRTFGRSGATTVRLPGAALAAGPAVIAGDGKILITGLTHLRSGDSLTMERLRPDGRPDPTFGSHGLALSRLSDAQHHAVSVGLESDGNILTAIGTTVSSPTTTIQGGGSIPPGASTETTFDTFQLVSLTTAPESPAATLSRGTLTIAGTTSADTIDVSTPVTELHLGSVIRATVNGVTRSFAAAEVHDVRLIWHGHGSRRHLAPPLAGTLGQLFG